MFLVAHFGTDEVELHIPDPDDDEPEQGEDARDAIILIRLDEADALINLTTMVGSNCDSTSHHLLTSRV